ncbi:single-stranded-DNA-specific exonuclease RecJ [Candidatus Synchoanobacter obligatus]|uniref:Single-stranded-DNA-specific exonuclease RecJ n=1 Tax=Candidatus Synchoanobacter obligatus TaxID=2919597 RepID=A0ABT1L614_9GAMM|nr:single-stranded-DNA-specific exonuclease RecJ [Candidatus Synchoanobacter obligatus]MCP8352616.1 single-stranded-DNA-specific exonuclease RecJ [Candidatus Synchoanobacter obligatus]
MIKERELVGDPLPGVDSVMDKIYRSRQLSSPVDVNYMLSHLLPYHLLKDIDRACELLYSVYEKKQQVIVIGDYDVDGATATSVMVAGLREMGLEHVNFIIPNRITDGYGLTPKLVDRAKSEGGHLIITVDNGIVSYAGVDHAKREGLEVLITDHHLAGDTLPDAVCVNPNQPGCAFPSKAIAGVGVAFYVLVALRAYFREKGIFEQGPNLLAYLDLVALGTVADCVQLDRNNRTMVANGLSLMRKGKSRFGIQALMGVAKRSPTLIEADDMGFSLAPRLNAAGRLDDMTIGVKCLLAETIKDAKYFALRLDDINKTRRDMQQVMTQEALDYVKGMKHIPSIAVVCQPKWHEGIIGLVASMIKERFHIPSIVLTQDEDKSLMKGSCRSIPGLNIRDVLADYDRMHPSSLTKFGGHAMAAGLTMNASDVDQFRRVVETLCSAAITDEMKNKYLYVDGTLPASHRTIGFAKKLIELGPWGNGFEKPMFYDEFTLVEQYVVGGKHLKVVLSDENNSYDGIVFNIEEGTWPNHRCQRVRVAYHVQVNAFNGKRKLQFLVTDIQTID